MGINKNKVNERAIDIGIFGNLLGIQSVGLLFLFINSLKKMSLNNSFLLVVFFSYFMARSFLEVVDNGSFSFFSYINAFITVSTLYLLQEDNIHKLKHYLVKLSIVSVPLSLFISVLFGGELESAGIRTNEVFGLARLTFFFSEPSHYAVFLSFNLINAKSINISKWGLLIISVGLLLTWSLSGYFLFAILLVIYRANGNYIKLLFNSLFIFLFLVLFWTYFIDGSGFWIEKKFDTLLNALNGGSNISSSLVRYLSTMIIFDYLYNSFGDVSFLFGEGSAGYELWIESYFLDSYGISKSGELFNYLAALLVSSGVIGFLLYFSSMIRIIRFNKISKDKFFLSAFALSLFSGYLYGFIAVLFWLLVFSYSYSDNN